MKRKKSIFILLIVGMLLVLTAPAMAAPKVILDGSQLSFDVSPTIDNGRTLVPLRAIFEALGADIEWNGETKTVTANKENTKIILQIGKQTAYKNGTPVTLDVPAKIINDRTMVPLRFVSEALGADVKWDENTQTIIVSSNETTSSANIDGSGVVKEKPAEEKPTEETSNPIAPSEPPISESPIDEATFNKVIQSLAAYKSNLKMSDGSVINSEELLNKKPSDFTLDEFEKLKTHRNELIKYKINPQIKLPDGSTIGASELTIMGEPIATAKQLKNWINKEMPRIKIKAANTGKAFYEFDEKLADLYIEIGKKYGIRGDLAFAQATKETAYWQFTGSVQPYQNNYCGLWAIGSPNTGEESLNGADTNQVSFAKGVHGAIFATPDAGVEAHIQHLYAYATSKDLPSWAILLDPRFILVNRGASSTWEALNARWAVPGTTYGQSLIQDYWMDALK
ncbi:copper amine oxidase domain protein [Desulfofarcimen acetoxidans DSM 771]|uniref:Copper amine oxidase domain protein n=1 Tax=Desulfofarcimen acetoxidans (strain ATCC 49208 / DSM 771 / KCTC 5769 / VKM B-1644 / 5575) TaxID=485916 RepID=C8VZZ7_DESAS|nr:stalk domain-containing protein [Desulfofarcimen acetoxidans]ACV64965.1 copper amine oxidase domain protein [Desulfofarcimen acetoxidans DSM 771]